MSNYLAIRDAAVEQIKTGMAPLYPKMTIEAHPGLFTEQSIKRDAQRTPAILTSLVKASDGEQRDSIIFVSWVLYRASSEDKLYDGALRIISELIPIIRKADFDLDIKNTNIEAECLYSGALDAINITMWAVKWELVLGNHAVKGGGSLSDLEEVGGYDGTTVVGTVEIKDQTKMEE
ncbi:MAG: hypothetical protein LBH20_01760 [Treponema sp.]|jgi:hypothetical protein|nr:hypothetical protein [Treponema sp.]